MSFRRALAAFALCAVPAAAFGQQNEGQRAPEARKVEVGYEITFAGFAGFRVDFSMRFDGANYDAESRTFKEGLLRSLTLHYEGRNRAWGKFTPQGAQPSAGSLSIVVGDKPRTWLAKYGPGGLLSQIHNPEWKPEPKAVIPDDKMKSSLDPMSAGLAVGMAGDTACDQVAPSNDGKRRIDVILKKVRTETPQQAGIAIAQGDLLVCDMYTKRVAGEFYDAPEEAESKKEDPMRVWLARLDETPFRYPVKLEAKTGFGTIRGKTLYFRESPLSESERTQLPR
jgi:hypothetical protein